MKDLCLTACEPGTLARPSELTDARQVANLPVDSPGLVSTVDSWRTLCPDGATDDLDWWLQATVDADTTTTIRFDGLTFPATVFVDDQVAATVESMFLPVTVVVPAGTHRLTICFHSLTAWAKKRRPRGRWRSSLVATQGLRWARTTLLGRAPVYGGNPAPVGVWRAVSIHPLPAVDDLRVRAQPDTGLVDVDGVCHSGDGAAADGLRLTVAIIDAVTGEQVGSGDTQSRADGGFTVAVSVPEPRLWWPNGYGEQHRYRAVVSGDVETVERTIGFRTLAADVADDGFRLMVNGVPIFCRGAVWTPADPAGLYTDEENIRRRLTALAQAGATMVRIPGGLVYEQPEFWTVCAELGLLVWQDAMLATFDPPDDLSDVMIRELRTVLDAVSGNPAIAVVSGGSETIQQPVMLGLAGEAYRMPLLEQGFRSVAEERGIPYVESSPSAPPGSGRFPLRADTGVSHWFGVGGYRRPLADVRSAGVRFAAESLAFAIPPSPDAVEKYFGSAAAAGHLPVWKAGVPRDRGSAWDFEDTRDHYVAELFGIDPMALRSRDPERYLQLGRVTVAETMFRCYVHWRADPTCGGALVLTVGDLAPGAGWGLLDVDGSPKLPVAMLTRVWRPVTVLLTDVGMAGIRIDVHNDTDRDLVGAIDLVATGDGGATVIEGSRPVTVAARGSVTMVDAEVTGVFRDLSDAYRFGPQVATAVEVGLRVAEHIVARDVLVVDERPWAPTPSPMTAVATRLDESAWELEIRSDVAVRWVEIRCTGWEAEDSVFHLAAGLPYRVRLTPLTSQVADQGPSGCVDTPDRTAVVPIEVDR
ncbi:glycoside hydrolase family 2 protein [Williamsia sterculiae]|uniref:beta-mannosidase n=1 Tax=Williamsia sterculiae TaxID=1344003 RepID=A0A1N7CIN2_9NOCA|nr:hypothetical protein [Williamsia sterculiae]SIR63383.1 beta-mannosidase [Williamsia sterculiae]